MDFNNTTTGGGLIQECERICQLGAGGISLAGSSLLSDFTARINQALDRFCYLAMMADGKWQLDDTGQTTLPIGTTNLVSGQMDYEFADELLAVQKVFIKDTNGNWVEMKPVDVQETNLGARDIWLLPTGNTGSPTTYDKLGNSILLNPIPNYNSTNGLKVVFTRNFTQFLSTDTAATPGIPSIFHGYLALEASYPFMRDTGKDVRNVQFDITKAEDSIEQFYSKRTKDEKTQIVPAYNSPR